MAIPRCNFFFLFYSTLLFIMVMIVSISLLLFVFCLPGVLLPPKWDTFLCGSAM